MPETGRYTRMAGSMSAHRLITIIQCNPWASFMRWLEYQTELDYAEYQLSEDRRTERELADLEMSGQAECPWPWYADRPYEVFELAEPVP
jgi:hypothetical protein